ncbi:carbamoyltransferase HypF [Roseibium sp.]|uniref:carbamoyltransferase HypF n=1 Tax=Roseibium sp. TaxID=1936156 RepID=UPI003B50D198
MTVTATHVRIKGLVQGVGFRPFIWHLANEEGLTGHVLNDADGVLAEIFGAADRQQRFLDRLRREAPPLSEIESVETAVLKRLPCPPPEDFQIVKSVEGPTTTAIVPDAATCPACLADIFDPANRRHGYAFTNCTHCGPRLSIVTSIPYDRANTSMAAFKMCPECQREYDDPADRRFHAQPNACPACGPQLWAEAEGTRLTTTDPIRWAASRLEAGEIIALKGLGGFHLAVDATNDAAVSRLREKKNRPDKPLAVMVRNLEQARAVCHVSEWEAALLQGRAGPIVLLKLRAQSGETPILSGHLAPGLDQCGLMLPATPLHHLLMAAVPGPLVMTSGNRSEDPQVITNEAARRNLGRIADGFLMHDREIVNRLDDSVIRADQGGPVILRRARGHAPAPLALHNGFQPRASVLAMGGELKSTFCQLRQASAVVSQHMGDLESRPVLEDYEKTLSLYRHLYDFEPDRIAVDLHPEYVSTHAGRRLAADLHIPLIQVQHHHAHLAACMAEHGLPPDSDPVLGIVLDGSGLGSDGTIWGGEFLVGGYEGFERAGHFLPVALPGGAAAVREPWRNLVAHLRAAFGADWSSSSEISSLGPIFTGKTVSVIEHMIDIGLNTPMASSAGRLFDAVAAALGICAMHQYYEGQTGALLEALARPYLQGATAYPVDISSGTPGILSWEVMWDALLSDLRRGSAPGLIAARFHLGLATAISALATRLAGARNIRTIALSGGVLQNAILADGLYEQLKAQGFEVLVPGKLPPNDGGLSLGQAAIAAVNQS